MPKRILLAPQSAYIRVPRLIADRAIGDGKFVPALASARPFVPQANNCHCLANVLLAKTIGAEETFAPVKFLFFWSHTGTRLANDEGHIGRPRRGQCHNPSALTSAPKANLF